MHVREAGGSVWFEPEAVVSYGRPRFIDRRDRAFYVLRWSECWNARSRDRFQSVWRLDTDPYRGVANWANTRRRYAYRPFTTPFNRIGSLRSTGRRSRRPSRAATGRRVLGTIVAPRGGAPIQPCRELAARAGAGTSIARLRGTLRSWPIRREESVRVNGLALPPRRRQWTAAGRTRAAVDHPRLVRVGQLVSRPRVRQDQVPCSCVSPTILASVPSSKLFALGGQCRFGNCRCGAGRRAARGTQRRDRARKSSCRRDLRIRAWRRCCTVPSSNFSRPGYGLATKDIAPPTWSRRSLGP